MATVWGASWVAKTEEVCVWRRLLNKDESGPTMSSATLCALRHNIEFSFVRPCAWCGTRKDPTSNKKQNRIAKCGCGTTSCPCALLSSDGRLDKTHRRVTVGSAVGWPINLAYACVKVRSSKSRTALMRVSCTAPMRVSNAWLN